MNELTNISVDMIRPCPENPRRKISQEELEELAQSIKSVGLLQPITVRRGIEVVDAELEIFEEYYEIVCGHRRYEAAKLAGNLGTAFHEYFQTLFVVFGERSDERDEIIDMMDRYGKFMEHDLQILLYSSMDCFMNDFGMEEETVLGSTLVLNSLADISRGIWMDAVADDLKNGRCDEKALLIANRIDAVLAKSKEFSFSYMKLRHKEETFVDEAMHRKLTMAVDAFANGTIRWIRQEAEYQRLRETEQIKDYGL